MITAGVAAVVGAAALTGCADEADDAASTDTTPAEQTTTVVTAAATPETTEAPTTESTSPPDDESGDSDDYAVGETGHTGDFDVTLHAVEDPLQPANEFDQPTPGNRLVGVEVTLTNTGDDPQTFSSLLAAELTDSLSRPWTVALAGLDRPQVDGDVPPGESRRGWMTFDVAEDADALRLRVKGNLTAEGAVFVLG